MALATMVVCAVRLFWERDNTKKLLKFEAGGKTQYIRTNIVVLQERLLLCAEKDSLSQCGVRLH